MWGTASISLATLILISIAVLFSSEAKIPRETNVKEGNCPKVHISEGHECPIPPDLQDMDAFNEFLKSVAECVVDADCNGTHKCCFDGCKTLCVSMKHGDKQLARQGDQLSSQRNQLFGSKKNRPKSDFIRPQSRLRKQGKCPLAKQPTEGCQWTPEHKLGYSISCETDEDCEETEGCCFDGCHFRCSELPNVDPSASSEDSGAKNGVGEKPRSIHWTLYLPERTADPVKSQTEKETVIPENKERKEESSTEDSENVNMNRRSDPKDERTFVKIWPSGVKRGLVGEIIRRFERKGCAIVGIKVATQKYDFMTEKLHLTEKGSDPVVVMVLKSNGIINSVKNIIGLEDPSNAEGGTINGDYMFEGSRRIVEASEDLKEAEGDIKFWFTKEELVG